MTSTLFDLYRQCLSFSETALTTSYKACPRPGDEITVSLNADTSNDEIRRTRYWNSSFEASIGAPYPRDILMKFAHYIVDTLNFLLNKFTFKDQSYFL